LLECYELKELPTSIGQWTVLHQLYLFLVFWIEGATCTIDQMTALQELDFSWCSKLKELHTLISQLKTLQKLYWL
jgi:hypothetical protein